MRQFDVGTIFFLLNYNFHLLHCSEVNVYLWRLVFVAAWDH